MLSPTKAGIFLEATPEDRRQHRSPLTVRAGDPGSTRRPCAHRRPGLHARGCAAAPVRPFLSGHPILSRRTRLDREALLPQPSDRDPTDQIRAYRFSLAYLLKSPRLLLKSTRNPVPFKTNSNQALFYSLKPLTFPDFVPAVQPVRFCT